jgi:phenylacetate-coenzyme A ligase PaaK-like adenylate-forming protein
MHLFDPREKDLPAIGLIHARDAETGQLQWVDTDSKRVRQHYTDWYENNMAYYKNAFKKSGADSMSIETTEDYTKALLGFFKGR